MPLSDTTLCGHTAETVSYTAPTMGPQLGARSARVLLATMQSGGATYAVTVTSQTTDTANPTYQQDMQTILTGFQLCRRPAPIAGSGADDEEGNCCAHHPSRRARYRPVRGARRDPVDPAGRPDHVDRRARAAVTVSPRAAAACTAPGHAVATGLSPPPVG